MAKRDVSAGGGHGDDWGPASSGGNRRGNPYHVPGGSPQGGQFTHGPVGAVKNATEHVTAQGHGVVDTRKTHASMTRKHFVMIADSLRESNASAEVVGQAADKLATTNPRFDRARFTAAALGWPKGVAPPTGNLSGRKMRGH